MTTNDTSQAADAAAPAADRIAISLREAARQSGLGLTTLYELMRSGELPYAKIGVRRLIFVDDLRAMLASHRQVASVA